ncbi:MAG: hypothetical protein M0002_09240 [Rhodospirillales bacterium]|nr:hypothetical protein [Rhodospirillales bacterium]
MEPGAERITLGTLLGWIVLALLIGAIATPLALWVGPEHHVVVVRLAGALFTAAVLYRLATAVRAVIESKTPSPAEAALRRSPPPAIADPTLLRLGTDIRSSLRRRGHFERVLWPCLTAIAESRGVTLPPSRAARRGAAIRRADLLRILDAIEEAE